jgi:hypothetical protein
MVHHQHHHDHHHQITLHHHPDRALQIILQVQADHQVHHAQAIAVAALPEAAEEEEEEDRIRIISY